MTEKSILKKKSGLGKGFNSIFPNLDSNIDDINKKFIQEIPLENIANNPDQPRKNFSLIELEELAQSIQSKGIIQPIILRVKGLDKFEIIAGERRWRAAKIAGIKKIKSIVYNIPENEIREMALIENIQRKDLNPIEEAACYHSLLEENSLTHDELARKVGKNRSTITNLLRLLTLPKNIIDDIVAKKLTMGHAKCLLSLDKTEEQIFFKNLILDKQMSVRELEKEIKRKQINPDSNEKIAILQDDKRLLTQSQLEEYQEKLTNIMQTNVQISEKKKGGSVSIYFYTEQDLHRIMSVLTKKTQ